MHAFSSHSSAHELRSRREKITRTVEYLRNERVRLERNASCMDACAYRRRKLLFESLAGWYDIESEEINEALGQLGCN